MKPTLYLMVGYPGAGKTTVAQIIHELTGAVHIWADEERQKMFGHPSHNLKESKLLYSILNDETAKLLAAGKSVIFDTNFSFRRDRDHLHTIADGAGAHTCIVWVNTDRALARTRATQQSDGRPTRVFGNMSAANFERLANQLEIPAAEEQPVIITGVGVTPKVVRKALQL